MKCPRCQAKLLPVAGELFCLQCGEAVQAPSVLDGDELKLEETTDPLLRRAISDANDGATKFTVGELSQIGTLPVVAVEKVGAAAPAQKAQPAPETSKRSFVTLQGIFAPPRAVTTGGTMSFRGGMGEAEVAAAVEPAIPSTSDLPELKAPELAQRGAWLGVRYWALGVAGLALFLTANVAAANYYTNRVLPGVRIGHLAVGGWTFDELHQRLPLALPQPKLTAVADGHQYRLDLGGAAGINLAKAEGAAKLAGRTPAIPAIGLMTAWAGSPVALAYDPGDDTVDKAVTQLASLIERLPSDAIPIVLGTNAQVLADKPGTALDKVEAAAAIRAAYGNAGTVSISPVRLKAMRVAADYANDIPVAQAMIGQSVVINLKKAHYTPTASQIAGWIVFNGPGKGASVDPAGVAGYVAGIPGSFDRGSAVNGLISALNAHQNAALTISSHSSANPRPVTTLAWPLAQYSYCVDESTTSKVQLTAALASTLSNGGWGLGGRVRFAAVKAGCNFKVSIGNNGVMAALDFACRDQSTCRIHNDLAISSGSWAKAPASWSGDISSYRTEMINHVVGQWLGFDHPSCSAAPSQVPILSTPSVTVPGCSAQWYPVPPELQDTKVLAGF